MIDVNNMQTDYAYHLGIHKFSIICERNGQIFCATNTITDDHYYAIIGRTNSNISVAVSEIMNDLKIRLFKMIEEADISSIEEIDSTLDVTDNTRLFREIRNKIFSRKKHKCINWIKEGF